MQNQLQTDEDFMRYALKLAHEQLESASEACLQEVPVAAIVVYQNAVIGQGTNLTINRCDPTAHAEIMAIRDACSKIGNHRLVHCSLYVTLEPCIMCAGAILQARIERLIYAARDERFGAAGSLINVLESPLLNHRCHVIQGYGKEQSQQLLQSFFRQRRNKSYDT